MSMTQLKRYTIILALIEKLREKGSWCGETHIQKATFFLKELFNIPLEYNFILYKHGPYSFDLKKEITAMRADLILKMLPQYPYGSTVVPSEGSKQLKEHFSVTFNKFADQIGFIAEKLGDKRVIDLERLATALYVIKEFDGTKRARAEKITKLKPHIASEDACEAINEVSEIIKKSKELNMN